MVGTDVGWRGSVSRRTVRVVLATVVVLSLSPVAANFVGAVASGHGAHPPAPAADAPTVVSDQTGHLVVYAADGSVVYDDHRYDRYWDVDPLPGDDRTLLYTATTSAPASACDGEECDRNVVGHLNLTTGQRTPLFSRAVHTSGSHEWHDVDRVNETHVAVADIREDGVFVADVRTDEVTWRWNAAEHFPPDSGGKEGDWTHLNDVEVLPDGRLMVSIRNQDSVVFVEPGEGVQANWTLGAEGNHSVLFGQHNADYVPASRGGPAVVVADSHNNRVVEFQRVDGGWRESWRWADARMQWTRDADRLPDGHTLVTDTNGDRVLEIDRNGAVVWSVQAPKAYEAERLGTGDESAGGPSAIAVGLESRTDRTEDSVAGWVRATVTDALPAFAFNSVLYVLPLWMDKVALLLVIVALVTVVAWGVLEVQWRGGPRAVLGPLGERAFER